jgi:DNA-binding NarL/FixJ family response regulator
MIIAISTASLPRAGNSMRLLILEDEPHWQQHIREIAEASPELEIVGVCSSLAEAFKAIKSVDFEMIVVDLGLPDGNGVDAIRLARRERPKADILVATVFADESSVVAAICAGATGYIVKDSTPQEWIAAIADLRAGHSPLSPKIAAAHSSPLAGTRPCPSDRAFGPGRIRRSCQAADQRTGAGGPHGSRERSFAACGQGVFAGRGRADPARLSHHDADPRKKHLSKAGSQLSGRSRI